MQPKELENPFREPGGVWNVDSEGSVLARERRRWEELKMFQVAVSVFGQFHYILIFYYMLFLIDFSHRPSVDMAEGPRESEVVVLKERRLIPINLVREGMARFSFLLETCAPGSIPDPPLIAALLDLPQAPIVARAALLMECAHFVHLCNRGQWPSWMKQNIPSFRPSGPALGNRASLAAGARRIHILQRAAGKMFHQVRFATILLLDQIEFYFFNW